MLAGQGRAGRHPTATGRLVFAASLRRWNHPAGHDDDRAALRRRAGGAAGAAVAAAFSSGRTLAVARHRGRRGRCRRSPRAARRCGSRSGNRADDRASPDTRSAAGRRRRDDPRLRQPAADSLGASAAHRRVPASARFRCRRRRTAGAVPRGRGVAARADRLAAGAGTRLYQRILFHSVRTASADRVHRMAAPRRHLALVCFLHQAWRDTLDQAVDMYGKLLDRNRKLVEARLDDIAQGATSGRRPERAPLPPAQRGAGSRRSSRRGRSRSTRGTLARPSTR